MHGVIATAHGEFAKGLYSGLRLIAGPMENLRTVDFLEGDGFELLDEKLKVALQELKEYDSLIILTDLAGGTPFNRAVMMTGEMENVRVVAGMNFQMLYGAVTDESSSLDEAVENIFEMAKEACVAYKPVVKQEESDDDGI